MATFRFCQFLFDSRSGRLLKGGSKVRLQRKPQQLLTVLLENAGELVTREQLHSCLWPGDAYRDFETGLNVAVKKLRDALCDSAGQPIYVATEVGLGYRFIAEVQLVPDSATFHRVANSMATTSGQAHTADSSSKAVPELAAARATHSSGAFPRPSHLPITAVLGGAAGVLVLIALGLVTWNRASAARPLRAVITLPPELRLMSTGDDLGLAISPDGTQVAFAAVGPENRPQLWLRRLDSLTPEAIPGTEGGTFPFWSPDGKDIGYFAGTQLKRTNLTDHSVKGLSGVESGRGGTWSKEGVILFAPGTRGPIYRISAEGGPAKPLTVVDESHYTSHRWPTFLPDGNHFVYLAENHDKSRAPGAIFLGSLEGRAANLLGESDSNVVPAAGSLLFLSHGKLISQPLNLETAALESRADILADGVNFESGLWYGEFSASATELIYRPRQDKIENNKIAWFDRKGNKLRDAGPPGIYRDVHLAPDGKTLATSCGDPEVNVCLIHGDDSVTQLTHGGINAAPAWAFDSSFVSYYMHSGQAKNAIALKPLDGGSSVHILLFSETSVMISSWHPDKRHALLVRCPEDGRLQYFIFDLATNTTSPYLPPDSGMNEHAGFSPDGNWVAYSKQSAGKDEIYIVSYPVPTTQLKINGAHGRGPKWRGDGRELYYLGPDGNLYALPVKTTGASLSIGAPESLFRPPIAPAPWDLDSFDVTRDGSRFLVNTTASQSQSELVLTTNWQKTVAK